MLASLQSINLKINHHTEAAVPPEQQAARSPLTAKLTAWVNRPELRIRFSTVLLILTLINFPFLMGFIPMRWLHHAAPQFQSLSTFFLRHYRHRPRHLRAMRRRDLSHLSGLSKMGSRMAELRRSQRLSDSVFWCCRVLSSASGLKS
jgi:hypothetical protein